MNLYRAWPILCTVLTLGLVAGRVHAFQPNPAASHSEGVTIFAAASTSSVVQELADRFQAQSGHRVTTSFGASSTLAHQIAQGAPADVFLSASPEWARFLRDRGEVVRSANLLASRLVIVVPRQSKRSIRSLADLASASIQRIALGDPEHVPAGRYARQALEKSGLWEQVRSRIVAADNVREALAFVARGEVDVGIVYTTDAPAESGVMAVATIDEALHEPVRYPLVLLKRSGDKPAALAFFDYLQSSEATAAFQRAGFTVLFTSARPASPASPAQPATDSLNAIERSAILLSLWVASWAVALSLPPGVALGYWLARTQSRWKAAVETLVNLPLVLPPVVTGYLLLVVFGRRGWVGAWLEQAFGLSLAFTWRAAAMASAVVSFPLMVRAIRLSFQGVDARLEKAARTLGASAWNAFWSVSVPLARNGIIAGCVLAFARSLGEFGATIMFAGNVEGQSRTIPVAIYTLINQPEGIGRSWRLVVVSVLICAIALVASEALERRGARREST